MREGMAWMMGRQLTQGRQIQHRAATGFFLTKLAGGRKNGQAEARADHKVSYSALYYHLGTAFMPLQKFLLHEEFNCKNNLLSRCWDMGLVGM